MPELIDFNLILALRNLHRTVNEACAYADLNPTAAACLMIISEHNGSAPLGTLGSMFAPFLEPLHYIETLEASELISRRRDSRDRRRFVLNLTEKGASRTQLIEDTIAAMLIGHYRKLTESAFENLVEQLHAVFPAPENTLIPAESLRALCLAHHIMGGESSRLGITSLQATTICLMAHNQRQTQFTLSELAQTLGVSEAIISIQVDSLEERQLVKNDGMLALTETGFERAFRYETRLTARLLAESGHGEKRGAQITQPNGIHLFSELCEYCSYLFG